MSKKREAVHMRVEAGFLNIGQMTNKAKILPTSVTLLSFCD